MSNRNIRHALAAALRVILLCVMVNGCGVQMGPSVVGSGVARSELRSTGEFKSVENNISADIDVTVGPATEVVVEGDDNLLPHVTTELRGGTLVISSNTSFQCKSKLKVTIKTPQLTGLVINGSGNANIRGLNGGPFDGAINGSGDVIATGKVNRLDARINGSGNLHLKDLTTEIARIAITGSGNASVDARDSLDASITGSGDVTYKPAPSLNVQTQIVGSGSIRPM